MLRFFAIVLAVAATIVQAATPTQNADLSVTLTDSPDPVRRGEPLTYRITVFNHGPDVARNVRVNLSAPGGMPVLSMDSSCRFAHATLKCTLEELAPSASASFQVALRSNSGVRQTGAGVNVHSDSSDFNDSNNARGQVTRVLYRIPTPEERTGTPSTPKLGGRSCAHIIAADGATADEGVQPALTPVEINGVWVVALPQGFQDLMPGSNSLHRINVLLTAIDQPGFPDWIKLKRAVFTQGEAQQELLLDQDQEACGHVRPYGIEKNEKLLCADPQQVRLTSSRSIAMHLMFEDNQGHPYEIVDEFCSFTPM